MKHRVRLVCLEGGGLLPQVDYFALVGAPLQISQLRTKRFICN